MKHATIYGLLLSSALTASGLASQSVSAQEAQASAPGQGEATGPVAPGQAAQTSSQAATEPPAAMPAETVIVSGIRRSLESARNAKRNASQIVDSIVADDIGKLPDRNVAESLSRVSGVQVDRGIAEGTSVSIRGLRQNVTLFNGREIFDSTGRGGIGLDQNGTSTYGVMALVPSDLIARLDVTKLAGAEQVSGGLGGIIDIRTRMPLDGPESQVAVRAAATYDQLPGKTGSELFGMWSGKFANNTLGFLLSVSADTRKLAQEGLDTFSGYRAYNQTVGGATVARFGNQDVRAQDIAEKREKRGLSAAVQWRPSNRLEISADTFMSKLESDRDRYWLSFNPTDGLSNARYSSNNILLSGRATTAVLSNTEFAAVDSDVKSSAVRARFAVTDSLRANVEASYGTSKASFHQLYFRLQPLAGIQPVVDFDLSKGRFGEYAIGGIDFANPATLRHTILFDNLYRAETDTKALRADFTHSTGWDVVDSIEFGARYNVIDSLQNPLRADIRPSGGIPASQMSAFLGQYASSGAIAGLPANYTVAAKGAFGSCADFASIPAIARDPQCIDPASTVNSRAGTFDIREKFTDAYAKLNYDTDVGGVNVSGNAGVRFVQRKLESTGNIMNASGASTPTTFLRDDTEALPSAVARVDLGDGNLVRLGAARVAAFPNTADLNNGVTLSNNAVFVNGVQTGVGSGSGGSPNLDPFKANQVDVSFEKYFGKQALASLGLFNKNISSFIVQQQSAESYNGVNYFINRKVNGQGAKVKGAELLVQLPFYFAPEVLRDFGVMATYSYIDSSTPIRDAEKRVLPFPGLSKNNVNLVLYYESGPLSIRTAYNWRDEYLVSLSAANTGIYSGSFTDVGATVRYDINKSVSLNLEANNLLNSRQRTYDGAVEALRTNAQYGRIFKASVSLKF
ncbi:TonB-dependent receptor [Massilia sp. G4R7]|uniref:TonB-dependent receptor n=1 Tax=Massilia phyllostachyos TaxID=2898585 RepID=A0ABS8Q469_9BURK|nr:TonB-dependent receptor [Massilia phyllostachyos]MCD2515435.1 TonB-dependent receptor [Massilia phyllostachyos]